jgi:uncharacterized protein DUF4395
MVVLLLGYLFKVEQILPLMAAALAVGPLFGLRYSPLGATYRAAKKIFKLHIPVVPEEEAPPRFAQLMGLIFLGLATVSVYGLESTGLGWTFGLIVAGLQGLLGVSGICVGCEVYLFGRRLAARGSTT